MEKRNKVLYGCNECMLDKSVLELFSKPYHDNYYIPDTSFNKTRWPMLKKIGKFLPGDKVKVRFDILKSKKGGFVRIIRISKSLFPGQCNYRLVATDLLSGTIQDSNIHSVDEKAIKFKVYGYHNQAQKYFFVFVKSGKGDIKLKHKDKTIIL